jgi:hypothetical protein
MEAAVQNILSAAGFAGALLIVLGWAYWKKDQSEKAAQIALVRQAEKHKNDVTELQSTFIAQLITIADKRTSDAQHVGLELLDASAKQTNAMREVAVTNTEVRAALVEVRREIRHRNRTSSRPSIDLDEER